MSSTESADGEPYNPRPPKVCLEAFDLNRGGMNWHRVANKLNIDHRKQYTPEDAQSFAKQYLDWSREESRIRNEETLDFNFFSMFDIKWGQRRITCPMSHKNEFKNPVYHSDPKRSAEDQENDLADMVKAMREHRREHH